MLEVDVSELLAGLGSEDNGNGDSNGQAGPVEMKTDQSEVQATIKAVEVEAEATEATEETPTPKPTPIHRGRKVDEQREREQRQIAAKVLNLVHNDPSYCKRFYADADAVKGLTDDEQRLANAIRQHWERGENEPMTRKGFNHWNEQTITRKVEMACLEVLFNSVTYATAKGADFAWMLDRLGEQGRRSQLSALMRSIDNRNPTQVAKAKAIAAKVKAKELTIPQAIDAMKLIVGDGCGSNEGANLICLANVAPKSVDWLWFNRFPLGKMVLLFGDPGLGKSMLTLDCVSRVSTGADWSDGAAGVKGKAIVITAEDDLADTIVPRLKAAGADLSNVFAIETVKTLGKDGKPMERCFSLADMPQLEAKLIEQAGVKLVVIDPVSAFLNGTDSHRDADIRQLLTPLTKLAARHGVCILLVTHMNKGGKGGKGALYRAMGSVGIAGAVRAAYLVCKDTKDMDRRLMLPIKNNCAPDTGGLSFAIQSGPSGPTLAWDDGKVSMTADEALSESEAVADPQRHEAKELIADMLKGGPVKADEMLAAARAQGISERTLRRARAEMKVNVERVGFGRGSRWEWSLAKSTEVKATNADDADDADDLTW